MAITRGQTTTVTRLRTLIVVLTGALLVPLPSAGAAPPEPAPGCLVAPAAVAVRGLGSWTAPESLGIDGDGSSAVVMPTGEVLLTGGGARAGGVAGEARVFDPATATVTPVDPPDDPATGLPYDLTDAGVAVLGDGTVLVVGGGEGGGSDRMLVFDPYARVWRVEPHLTTARSDPLLATLPDGRVVIAGGAAAGARVEVFTAGDEPGAPGTLTSVRTPRGFRPSDAVVGPDGRVRFPVAGPDDAWLLDPGTLRFVRAEPAPADAPAAGEAAPAEPAPADAPAAGEPPRSGLVPLPGGETLALGDPTSDAPGAELFSPTAGEWGAASPQHCPRTARSSAVLLPDGRVLSEGRDPDTGAVTYEILMPPSLTGADRPAIDGGERSVAFGADFAVTSPDAARITSALLVAPSAVAHGVDAHPVAVPVPFVADGEKLTVTAPAEGTLPPGHDMLVLVDASGVASPARWIALGTPFRPPHPADADVAPPTIDAVTPAAGSDDVPVDARIVVDLDEPVDPASLGHVRLVPLRRGARDVAVVATIARGGTRLVLSPAGPLAPVRAYRVTLPPGLTDLAGNATPRPTSWTFTTVDPAAPAIRPQPTPLPDPVGQAPDLGNQPAPGGALDLPGTVLRSGDYDTGDLSQWSGHQSLRPYSLTLVHSPARRGYAARFEVRAGDDPICAAGGGCYGDRSEVQMATGEREGDERWYSWSTMFAPDFPRYSAWQVVAQWHADADGSPPVGFFVEGDQLVLQFHRYAAPGDLMDIVDAWRGPLDRGRWLDIRMHVKWSGSDSVGFVELWIDGVRQTFDNGATRRYIRTMYPGVDNYFKQGLYRQGGLPAPGVVYQDGFRMTRAG